jgi:hypothetical protein
MRPSHNFFFIPRRLYIGFLGLKEKVREKKAAVLRFVGIALFGSVSLSILSLNK